MRLASPVAGTPSEAAGLHPATANANANANATTNANANATTNANAHQELVHERTDFVI